jgi:hypothetical protein
MCLAIAALFAVAMGLSPASEGLGTHRQLGLPPCSTRVLFGVRCPMCGMTTAWSHFVRGDLAAAARSNLGGLLLAVYAIGWIELARRMAVHQAWPTRGQLRAATLCLVAILAVTLADWCLLRLTW